MQIIQKIKTSHLTNKDFYQLVENLLEIADGEPLLARVSAELKDDIPAMQLSFKKEKLNAETENIVALDKKRDRAFMRLRSFLESETYNDMQPENIPVAKRILLIINNYGGGKIPNFDMNGETATLTNLIIDLKEKTDDIAHFALETQLDYIQACNEDFRNYYKGRGDAAKELNKVVPMFRLRPDIEKRYRKFLIAVENIPTIVANTDDAIEDIIIRFNVEIEKFRLLLPVEKSKLG